MFETTRTYLSGIRASRWTSAIQFTTIAFVLLCNLSIVPLSWSEQCGQEKYDKHLLDVGYALAKSPIIDAEAQGVALNFVDNTLRHLLADDPILGRQLGFTRVQDLQNLQESGAMLESPLPLYIINLKDLRDFVKKQTLPLGLLAGDINWIRVSDEDLGPARFLFPIRLSNDAANNESSIKSSVMIEKSPMNSWRIHNAGGPRLIRAVKLYSTRKEDFLVWIPGINRHYLGRMGPDFRFKMTVLFDDPVARVNAGHEFDPCDSNVLDKLQHLDKLLQPQITMQPVEVIPAPVRPRGTTER